MPINRVTDIEVDEVSFVTEGANPRANIVLMKGVDDGWEEEENGGAENQIDIARQTTALAGRLARGISVEGVEEGLSQEAAIARAYQENDWLYASECQLSDVVSALSAAATTDLLAKHEAVETISGSAIAARHVVRSLAQQYQEDHDDPNRLKSLEAQIVRVYAERPDLYEEENALSSYVSEFWSRTTEE